MSGNASAADQKKRAVRCLRFDERLSSYAAAASAAIACLGSPAIASAEVVYTPFNYYLSHGAHCVLRPDGLHPALTLSVTGTYFPVALKAAGINQGEIAASSVFVPVLDAGQSIGPNTVFSPKGIFESLTITSSLGIAFYRGNWSFVSDGYLGFEFKIKGQTHYGWARMTTEAVVLGNEGIVAWITGLAYETVPGKPIMAGYATESVVPREEEPASLGALAFGARAIPIWRNKAVAPK